LFFVNLHSAGFISSTSAPPILHGFFILPRNTDLFPRLSLPPPSPLSRHRCRCHPTPVASAADWRLHDAARLLLLPCLLPRHRRLAIPGANPCRLDSLRSQPHYIRITMARAEPGPGQQGHGQGAAKVPVRGVWISCPTPRCCLARPKGINGESNETLARSHAGPHLHAHATTPALTCRTPLLPYQAAASALLCCMHAALCSAPPRSGRVTLGRRSP
jgi:hypothetical protein